jgi:VWFA-related protein
VTRAFPFLLCCVAAAQDQTFHVTTHVVQVPVVVTSKNGRAVDGLAGSDFSVRDNGVSQEIQLDDFAGGLPPVSLVVAIQASGLSKLALPRIRRIAGLIEPVVSGARGEAAVASFDSNIHWLQDFTNSDDKIRAAIRSIEPHGSGGGHMFERRGRYRGANQTASRAKGITSYLRGAG